jgi:hypothetical protein
MQRVKSSPSRLGIYVGSIALAWTLVAQVLTPRVLGEAHAGRGPRLLSALVAREVEDLDGFLERWAGYSWTVTWLILVFGSALVLSTLPTFQGWLEARHGKAAPLKPSDVLGRRRARLVQGLIGVVLGGSLLSLGTGVEVWPFSPYRMYATIQGPSITVLRLYGITGAGEVDLQEVQDVPPFDRTRFQTALRRLFRSRQGCASMGGVARYAISQYRTLHPSDVQGSGALRGVRLYQVTWRLDHPVLTLTPDDRTLVCQWLTASERE